MMSTNPTRGENNDPPAWLESPKAGRSVDDDDERKASGTRKAVKTKKSRRSSVGTARSSYGGYDSEDEDEGIEEDCCCCPMDPVLFGITVFHLISGLLGIAGMVANIFYLSRPQEVGHYQDIVLRTYATVFCATIVAVELNWRFVMKRLKLLDLWIFRGFFYAYTGLQTTGEITSFDLKEISRPNDIVGIALVVAGIMYISMGSCCIKSVTETKRRAYQQIGETGEVESV
jgi:hypothetical protein